MRRGRSQPECGELPGLALLLGHQPRHPLPQGVPGEEVVVVMVVVVVVMIVVLVLFLGCSVVVKWWWWSCW